MRNPGGTLFCWSEEGGKAVDSFSCGHCCKVVFVPPKADPTTLGGMCYQCMKLVCPACVETGRCDPLEAKLEREERRYEALRSYGLA